MLKTNHLESKQKLLMAALEMFAINGFDGTSTRLICNKAGLNISLIPYYFNSKEGLYNAVIEMIAQKVSLQMLPIINKIEKNKPKTKKDNIELLHELIANFAKFALSKEIPNSFAVLIVREQVEPSPAFEILYETFMKHMHKTFCNLLSSIINKSESDPEVIFRVSTIIGQVISFRASRQVTLRALGQSDFSEEDIELIKKIIINQVDAIINAAGGKL